MKQFDNFERVFEFANQHGIEGALESAYETLILDGATRYKFMIEYSRDHVRSLAKCQLDYHANPKTYADQVWANCRAMVNTGHFYFDFTTQEGIQINVVLTT